MNEEDDELSYALKSINQIKDLYFSNKGEMKKFLNEELLNDDKRDENKKLEVAEQLIKVLEIKNKALETRVNELSYSSKSLREDNVFVFNKVIEEKNDVIKSLEKQLKCLEFERDKYENDVKSYKVDNQKLKDEIILERKECKRHQQMFEEYRNTLCVQIDSKVGKEYLLSQQITHMNKVWANEVCFYNEKLLNYEKEISTLYAKLCLYKKRDKA